MSQYHTREAWEQRLEERFRDPVVPGPLRVSYHLALMEGWAPLVREQLDLLRFCGLTEVHACCLGSDAGALAASAMAAERGIRLTVEYVSPNLSEYEHPTLCRLWRAACAGEAGAFLYLHTKGVSDPGSARMRRWRRAMQRYVVADWRENLKLLASCDFVGANWQELPRLSHFQGNFWMARADWIASLDDPAAYREAGRDLRVVSQPWSRMHAETWLGSKPWYQVRSLVGTNLDWWRGTADLDLVSVEVDGFPYERYDEG